MARNILAEAEVVHHVPQSMAMEGTEMNAVLDGVDL